MKHTICTRGREDRPGRCSLKRVHTRVETWHGVRLSERRVDRAAGSHRNARSEIYVRSWSTHHQVDATAGSCLCWCRPSGVGGGDRNPPKEGARC